MNQAVFGKNYIEHADITLARYREARAATADQRPGVSQRRRQQYGRR